MPKHCLVLLTILLLTRCLFASDADPRSPWNLPADETRQWVERLGKLMPAGWSVVARSNDIVIQRSTPVQWAQAQINMPAGESKPLLQEGIYRLTLRFGPKMTLQEYERLTAANAPNEIEREQWRKSIEDIPHKFDQYVPTNDDQRRRLAAYRQAVAKLALAVLPDLYTPDYSIRLLVSGDGWSTLHDRQVAAECEGVREAVLRYFGMYNPHDACEPRNVGRPEGAERMGDAERITGR